VRSGAAHPDPTNAAAVLLSGHEDQGLRMGQAPNHALFFAAPVRLSTSTVPAAGPDRADHRPAKLVHQEPCGLIAAEPKTRCRPKALTPFFWLNDMPHRPEPQREGKRLSWKIVPASRRLDATTGTQPQRPGHVQPVFPHSAGS